MSIMKIRKTYFGDMHGNSLKLIKTLQYTNQTSLDEILWKKLENSYTHNNVEAFILFLDDIIFVADKSQMICYLGDMLADRGQNDYLTLMILDKMSKANIKFEIILSNHDMEFLDNLENLQDPSKLIDSRMIYKYIITLYNLKDTLKNKEYLNNFAYFVNNYYQYLKVISLDYDIYHNPIIATHAPLNEKIIHELLADTKIKNTKDIKGLECLVDYLNGLLALGAELFKGSKFHEKLVIFTWNRETNGINPFMQYHLNAVHVYGHDGKGKGHYPNAQNLDNVNGKRVTHVGDLDGDKYQADVICSPNK